MFLSKYLPLSFIALCLSLACAQDTKWVGTWAAAPYDVGTNTPPSPGLPNNSLRQIIRVSLGGDTLRFKFSNEASPAQLVLKSVKIAVATSKGSIDATTTKELKFNQSATVTIPANQAVYSDPIAFKLTPRMDVAITIYYGNVPTPITGHPGSRTNSYLLAGDKTTATDFAGAAIAERWYTIAGLEVRAPKTTYAVAAFGNSITDGRGTTTDLQDRWTDFLSERLLANTGTKQVGMLNLGIGGNTVLGAGNSGVNRFNRDILGQQGVKWLIILHGVNDIGSVSSLSQATTTANNLINAYKKFIIDAHAKNIKVYGGTILPFKGNSYYNTSSDSCRRAVNNWIRTSGFYDAFIDFDNLMRDPNDPAKLLLPAYQNDGLHPTGAGYKVMGESINLGLFSLPEEQATINGAIPVPGTILIQDSVGLMSAGARLEYSINIAQTTLPQQPCYGIEANVAADADGSTFHLEVDGQDISGTLTVPNTKSWSTFNVLQSIAKQPITPGSHILRVVVDNGSLRIDWIRFSEPISSIRHQKPRSKIEVEKRYNLLGALVR